MAARRRGGPLVIDDDDDDDEQLSSHGSDDEAVETLQPAGYKDFKYCADCGELRARVGGQYYNRVKTPRAGLEFACEELGHTLLQQGAKVTRGQRRRAMARAARTREADMAAASERRKLRGKPQPPAGNGSAQQQPEQPPQQPEDQPEASPPGGGEEGGAAGT
jgi:phage FluMu protein Com